MTTNSTKPARIRLQCQECGRKWSVSANASDPQCPKCGGVDWEVYDSVAVAHAKRVQRILGGVS